MWVVVWRTGWKGWDGQWMGSREHVASVEERWSGYGMLWRAKRWGITQIVSGFRGVGPGDKFVKMFV